MRFKSKVVEIEAWQFYPTDFANTLEQRQNTKIPAWLRASFQEGAVWYQGGEQPYMTIKTPEGEMRANPGDWIILETEDEIYPCKDSVFQRKYEPA